MDLVPQKLPSSPSPKKSNQPDETTVGKLALSFNDRAKKILSYTEYYHAKHISLYKYYEFYDDNGNTYLI